MNYPGFSGPRALIAELTASPRSDHAVRLAGRLSAQEGSGAGETVWFLRDASGVLEVSARAGHAPPEHIAPDDVVALEGRLSEDAQRFIVTRWERLVRPRSPWRPGQSSALAPGSAGDDDGDDADEPRSGASSAVVSPELVRALIARDRMMRALRAFFQARRFVEVETPNLVPTPGTDVYLEAFESHFTGMGFIEQARLFLHTSPEFAMKRLLASGMERIVQVCKVYRNGEWTAQHNPEFTMVEWYRAFSGYAAIMDDVEGLVRAVVTAHDEETGCAALRAQVSQPFERLTVAEAFERHCGLDLLALDTADALRGAALARGLGRLSPGGGWDDYFHELMLTHVEPALGVERPTFLIDYPRPLAVLARTRDDDPRVAERFELYISGVELCNGFTELNDPVEQRARFEEDLARRQALSLSPYPMPEAFLEALAQGMPPSGGVALGLDRLLMLMLGASTLSDVVMRAV